MTGFGDPVNNLCVFAHWCAWAMGHDRPLILETAARDGKPGETIEGKLVRMSNCPVRRKAYASLPRDPFRSWVLLGVEGRDEPVPLEHVVSIELAPEREQAV